MGTPASAAEVAAMDVAVREVRGQYTRAKARVQAAAERLFATAEEKSMLGALLSVGVLLEKWAGTYRAWAVRGQREDGSDYSVSRFLDFGRKDVADAVESIAREAYDRSFLAAVEHTVEATAGDVKAAVTSPAVLWGAAAVGVVVVLVVVAALVRRTG